MEAHAGHAEHQHHHAMPTEGRALTGIAVSATLHCLTGCAIGEVSGVAIGTAAGFSDLGTIALAIGLAFLFGYLLTSLPLLRAGLALSVVIPIALASDTLSIATMEVVDNAILLVIPGAMDAGLGDVLFWGALSFALAIAFLLTVPVNRYLIARGKGHTAVHETGIHGGPPTKIVGAVVIAAFVFGTAVLITDGLGEDTMGGGHEEASMAAGSDGASEQGGGHGGAESGAASAATVPGLAVAEGGLALELDRNELPRGREVELGFRIIEGDQPITDFELEQGRRMHLIVVRRDFSGFQHLHPRMNADGRWSTPVTLPEAGAYRVFADFKRDGIAQTLGSDLVVDGAADYRPLAPVGSVARTGGYEVRLAHADAAGAEAELAFEVSRGGQPVDVEPYLGADGHLVALRAGDLAYLHVHPIEAGAGAASPGEIRFGTEFPSAASYRLFLQFKDGGRVRTAAFTYASPSRG